MVKLQDFARQQGVTDRQIQRLIKKYEAVLAGMVERKGSNGTWLTEDACDVLRSKMKAQPIEAYDGAKDLKIAELEERIRELEARIERKDILIESMQTREEEKSRKLEELQGNQFLLEDKERQLREAEAELAKFHKTWFGWRKKN